METRDSQHYDWYAAARDYTLRLVGIRSVSPGQGERSVAEEVLRILREDGLENAYTAAGLDPLPGDLHGRTNAYAFLRGASPRTIVLLGHIDTVGTQDYGALEPFALDPLALATRQEELAALAPELRGPLAAYPGDLMAGRGVVDMKSGVAANIAVMRRLAQEAREGRLPVSVVLLATPDEENESAGVLQAVRFLLRLRDEQGLEYLGAINTDYTTSRYAGDPHRYIYTGTIGKLLPSCLVIGREAHVGVPFDGLDANLLAAELIRDLSMNPELCDTVRGQVTPPPVTLRAADLKDVYNVQLAFAAYFYLNVLTFTSNPGELLDRLRQRAEEALARVLARMDAAERQWRNLAGGESNAGQAGLRFGLVLTYHELYTRAVAERSEGPVRDALAAEMERFYAEMDARERSLNLVRRLWTLSGLPGPAVVLYYSPPYYPHVAAAPCALHEAVRAVAAAHSELELAVEEFYPYISDMSYLRLDPGVDLAALTANMPQWRDAGAAPVRGSYSLPLDAIARLDLPIVNIGPYGWGVHQAGESMLMSYSFGVLPQLVYETVARLGR
jgi:arginine utilization protein RocB